MAAASLRLSLLLVLLWKGARVNAGAVSGGSALAAAASACPQSWGQKINADRSLDAWDQHGNTLLHYAIQDADARCVAALLAAGASPVAPSLAGLMPLDAAAKDGCVPCAQALLDKRAPVEGSSILRAATCEKGPGVLSLLLSVGASPNVQDSNGVAPLHVAAGHHGLECMQELISAGANVDERNMYGDTPLFYGCNDFLTINMLLNAGAQATARERNNETALHVSLRRGGCVLCSAALLAGGADIDAADEDGVTPLAMAARFARAGDVRVLLAAGADTHARDALYGDTPLHLAVVGSPGGCAECVQALLDSGADPDAANLSGVTARHLAEGSGTLRRLFPPVAAPQATRS